MKAFLYPVAVGDINLRGYLYHINSIADSRGRPCTFKQPLIQSFHPLGRSI